MYVRKIIENYRAHFHIIYELSYFNTKKRQRTNLQETAWRSAR